MDPALIPYGWGLFSEGEEVCQKNSFIKISASSFKFIITDNINSIDVRYSGILPDLFREGQGAVIEGFFQNKNVLSRVS